MKRLNDARREYIEQFTLARSGGEPPPEWVMWWFLKHFGGDDEMPNDKQVLT